MNVEQEIIRNEEMLLSAMKNAELDTLDNLISDKLIFNAPTGDIITKEMDLATYRSGSIIWYSLDCLDREICVINDIAIVSAKVLVKGAFLEQPIEGVVRFLRTWKKFSDRWQVVGGASVHIL